jgi:DNA mismatch repair protein MSH2
MIRMPLHDGLPAMHDDLHAPAGLPDVERLARKLDAKRNVTLADLCSLYRASARLPLIEEALRGHTGPAASILVAK